MGDRGGAWGAEAVHGGGAWGAEALHGGQRGCMGGRAMDHHLQGNLHPVQL